MGKKRRRGEEKVVVRGRRRIAFEEALGGLLYYVWEADRHLSAGNLGVGLY